MKTKLSTQLSAFSKIGSKKIELILALILIAPCAAKAQSLEISVERSSTESPVFLSGRVVDAPEDELWESVDQGFQVEVAYTVRLYRESTGLFRFLGDRIIEDIKPARIGEFDPFTKLYLIHDTGTGRTIRSNDRNAFLEDLLRIDRIPLEIPRERGSYYILAGAEISPIKLKPPLTILSIFSKRNRYQTDRHRADVPYGEVIR